MALDMDNLEDGPDLDNFDATADRGDAPVEPETKEPEAKEPETKEPAEEPEEPESEEPEAKDEPAPRDEKGKFTGIPKARFDEAVGKEREAREAAERRATALEEQLAQRTQQVDVNSNYAAAESQLVKWEAEHAAAMLDGEAEQAAKLAGQIRRATMELSEHRAQSRATSIAANTLESDRFELSIAQLEAEHPVLNPKSDTYDETLVNFIVSEKDRLMRSEGLPPSHAIAAAAKKILARFAPKDAPPPPVEGLGKAQADRKAAAVQKNLGVQKQQPASMKDSGLDSDKAGQNGPLPDVAKMTQEEFYALPESTKAKLRGDYV